MNREFSRQENEERTATSVIAFHGGSTRRRVAEPSRTYKASLLALIRGEQ